MTDRIAQDAQRALDLLGVPPLHVDLTLRCPVCDRRADMCFDHGDDWKKRQPADWIPAELEQAREELYRLLDITPINPDAEKRWREQIRVQKRHIEILEARLRGDAA